MKSLVVASLIMSIKPNVCRYWTDHPSSYIDSLVNKVLSRMNIPRLESVVTQPPTPKKRFRDTRCTTLCQLLDIDDEVMERADQTDILAMLERATDDATDAPVMNGSAY